MTTALAMLWATDGTPFVRICSFRRFFSFGEYDGSGDPSLGASIWTPPTQEVRCPLHDLSDFVLDHCFDDVPAVLLAFGQRFGKLPRLIGGYLARERRFIGIDGCFHQCRAGMMKRFSQHGPNQGRVLDAEARQPA